MEATRAEVAAPKLSLKRLRLTSGIQGPLIGLILLCAFFAFMSPYFLQVRNWLNILDQVTVGGIVAIGMTLVIIAGGIDLSVGSVLAFSVMVMGWLSHAERGGPDWPLPLGILAGLLTGAACGTVTGLLITVAKLPPFIATLAMMSILRGLANVITGGFQIIGYPDWFVDLAVVRHYGFLSMTVATFLLVVAVTWFILKYRRGGRVLYAIGGSNEVARLAGIKVKRWTVAVYALAGMLAALAGTAFAARLNSSQPSAGTGAELDAIAAAVIGGASLSFGGVGTVGGTVVGVLIIGVLHNGLNLLGINAFYQQVVIGVVIAAAVTFDTLGRKHG
ncbi:MAG: ABC transporter permease [Anaeromyxobacter sp.]